MQLYWIPVATTCLSLLLAGVSGSQRSGRFIIYTVNCCSIFGVALLIALYQGVNSDWQGYRYFVENCNELRCTYFEPGYDFITFVSSATLGFTLLKLLLIVCFAGSVMVVSRGSSSTLVVILAVASISVATLPLMLGAIRQAFTLPFLLVAAYLLQERRRGWALFSVVVAGSLHYSALVASLWYLALWFLVGQKPTPPRMQAAILRVGGIVGVTYLILHLLSISSLGNTVTLIARIGETGVGTDYVLAYEYDRDLAILLERIPLAIGALVLFVHHASSMSTTERIFVLMYIAGSTFFLATFLFDRNIAGRTMATFRLADVLVLVTVTRSLMTGSLRKISLPLALLLALLFVISKSYMTMATVGFFDE